MSNLGSCTEWTSFARHCAAPAAHFHYLTLHTHWRVIVHSRHRIQVSESTRRRRHLVTRRTETRAKGDVVWPSNKREGRAGAFWADRDTRKNKAKLCCQKQQTRATGASKPQSSNGCNNKGGDDDDGNCWSKMATPVRPLLRLQGVNKAPNLHLINKRVSVSACKLSEWPLRKAVPGCENHEVRHVGAQGRSRPGT